MAPCDWDLAFSSSRSYGEALHTHICMPVGSVQTAAKLTMLVPLHATFPLGMHVNLHRTSELKSPRITGHPVDFS